VVLKTSEILPTTVIKLHRVRGFEISKTRESESLPILGDIQPSRMKRQNYQATLMWNGHLETGRNAFRALLGIKNRFIAFAAVILAGIPDVINPTSRAYRNLGILDFRVFWKSSRHVADFQLFSAENAENSEKLCIRLVETGFSAKTLKTAHTHTTPAFQMVSGAENQENRENRVPGAFPIGSFPGFPWFSRLRRKNHGKAPKARNHRDMSILSTCRG